MPIAPKKISLSNLEKKFSQPIPILNFAILWIQVLWGNKK